ncbi:MAG: erythronate-4-phosphate dehydrogenase, partial [Cryomorphaceae bacterium]
MKPLRILADSNMRGVEAYFGPLGSVQFSEGRNIVAGDLTHTDVLLVRSVTAVNESLLQGTAVKFVGTATSGFDHVDTDYLARNNIGFSHAPGSNANSVVEFVFAAISAMDGKLESLLAGQALGIIGYGNIGRALVKLCEQLSISFVVYDPWLEEGLVPNPASLAQVLACSVITVHTSLTRESPWPSYHLIDDEALRQISEHSLLINASRGEVVDNSALLRLRSSGLGPSCVLDVWEGEPNVSTALLDVTQLGSAHIAGYSFESKFLATRMLLEAVTAHFSLNAQTADLHTSIPQDVELSVPPELEFADLLRWAF